MHIPVYKVCFTLTFKKILGGGGWGGVRSQALPLCMKPYSPLPERPRLSLRTINLIQSGMPVRKCISGEKSDIVLSNHNYGRRQIKAKWNNEEFGYFNTILLR